MSNLTSAPPAPVALAQRALLPDVLRGLAIWGILLVNMGDYAAVKEWTQTGLDRWAQALVDVFANGRFITIFAMLFGWGAAEMVSKYGGRFLLRRHVVLWIFGLLHAVFIWHGDIIQVYALLGLGVIFLVRLNLRAVMAVAALLLCSSMLFLFAQVPFMQWLATLPDAGLANQRMGTFPALAAQATYWQVLTERLPQIGLMYVNLLAIGGHVFGLMALGVAAQKMQLLSQPQQHLPMLKKMALWGLGLGLPFGLWLVWANTLPTFSGGMLATAIRMTGGLIMALGYVGALGYLAGTGKLGAWRIFAYGGRVALSNYIAQSLIMTSIFYPYAGAQYGTWGMAACLGLALLVGAVQLGLSYLLVQRFGRGPLEWLLRQMVYKKPATIKG